MRCYFNITIQIKNPSIQELTQMDGINLNIKRATRIPITILYTIKFLLTHVIKYI